MRFARLLVAGLALPVLLGGCPGESAAPPKPCCEQPEIPAGVAPFKVVEDEVSGPSDGQKVTLRIALSRPTKRDELYPVLHTLYRHAMKRSPFEPIQISADVYASEALARGGGDAQLAGRISREQSQLAPQCDNRIPYDFSEQVDRAVAASMGSAAEDKLDDTCRLDPPKKRVRYDEKFTHKLTYKTDVAQRSVEVSYPYLDMGKDEYVAKLKLTSALGYWAEFVTSLFRKVPDLKAVTYIGLHDDAPVVRITTTRQQFDSEFSSLQEAIAAHAAVTFQALGTGRSSEKAAEQEQEAFKLQTYKNALSGLPKAQVTISPKLAKAK